MTFFQEAKAKKATMQEVIAERKGRCRFCEKTIKPGANHLALLTPEGKCLARFCNQDCREGGEMKRWEPPFTMA